MGLGMGAVKMEVVGSGMGAVRVEVVGAEAVRGEVGVQEQFQKPEWTK